MFADEQKNEYAKLLRKMLYNFADVDIKTDEPNLFRTSSMKLRLEALLGRPIDIVRFRNGMDPHLRTRIIQDARYV